MKDPKRDNIMEQTCLFHLMLAPNSETLKIMDKRIGWHMKLIMCCQFSQNFTKHRHPPHKKACWARWEQNRTEQTVQMFLTAPGLLPLFTIISIIYTDIA